MDTTQTRRRKCLSKNWQEEIAYAEDKRSMVSKARQQVATQQADGSSAAAPAALTTTSSSARTREDENFFKFASTAATNVATLSAQIVAKRDHHLQPTKLGTAFEGCVPFGVPVMLQNVETQGLLSIDLHDRQGVAKHMKIVTTTSSSTSGTAPVLRNTWVLLPVQEDLEAIRMRYSMLRSVGAGAGGGALPETDPSLVLHYGQRFVVCSTESMALPAQHGEEPGCVFLASEARTASSQAKRSNAQETYYTPFASQKAWWTAVHAHPDFRQDMEFTPVKADAMFLIRHQLTATPLASTKTPYPNDFGAEYEVCAHRHLRMQVKNGHSLETDANFWTVVCEPEAQQK